MNKRFFPVGTKVTLEAVVQQKEEVARQLHQQTALVKEKGIKVLSPVPQPSKLGAYMATFVNGLALYDGFVTGIKVVKRLRSLFTRKG